jgi:hypothetical protein
MLRRVALVRTDVSEELSASFIRVTRLGELRTTPAVTRTDALCILHSHRRENHKSYKSFEESHHSGSGTDEICVPTLWY